MNLQELINARKVLDSLIQEKQNEARVDDNPHRLPWRASDVCNAIYNVDGDMVHPNDRENRFKVVEAMNSFQGLKDLEDKVWWYLRISTPENLESMRSCYYKLIKPIN